jgi:hypothetical protein
MLPRAAPLVALLLLQTSGFAPGAPPPLRPRRRALQRRCAQTPPGSNEQAAAAAPAGPAAAPAAAPAGNATKPAQSLTSVIDSYLSGEYRGFTAESPEPRFGQPPEEVVAHVLDALRACHEPAPYHGAAVATAFTTPLAEWERTRPCDPPRPWREMLRTSLNARALARRLHDSRYRVLYEWDTYSLDVAVGRGLLETATADVALRFRDRTEAVSFELRKPGSVWLVHDVVLRGFTEGVPGAGE